MYNILTFWGSKRTMLDVDMLNEELFSCEWKVKIGHYKKMVDQFAWEVQGNSGKETTSVMSPPKLKLKGQ